MMNKYRRNSTVIFADNDGKEHLYHPETSSFHELNDVGSMIWAELMEWITAEELVVRLLEQFEGAPRPLVENDVEDFLSLLEKRQLIDIVPLDKVKMNDSHS